MKFRFPIIIIDEDFRSENTSGLGIRALADAILTRSPDAVSATKALFHSTRHAAEDQAFDRESSLQFKLLRGRNQGEAMAANLKKREPRFRPRQRDY